MRNIDEKKVSNEDIIALFAKKGSLSKCCFDRNDFGEFLGSATVIYQNPEDATKAINDYNDAILEGNILTVEHEVFVRKIKTANAGVRKTLSISGKRGAGF